MTLIERFLEKLERTFQSERKYEFKYGSKTKDVLKNIQEIALAKMVVQNLIKYCLEK